MDSLVMQTYFLVICLLIVNDRCKVPVYRYLLVFFVFSCLLQGRLNSSPIPTTTLSSSRLVLMTVEPPTSPGQNSELSIYSRYWIAYASVPLPRLTDENRSNSSVDVNPSSSSTYDNHWASPSADPSSDRRRQSISSHDQRLSSPSDYGEEITYSPYPSLADVGSPSSDSNPRVRSSADSDPWVSSSWRPIIGLYDQKVKKDRGSPMILFDEHGEMHRNYYTPFATHDNIYK
eukprot:XP_016660832.1 PREDICTED: uncharacterized protein LOC107884030 [Acyrthosiphon pisum]